MALSFFSLATLFDINAYISAEDHLRKISYIANTHFIVHENRSYDHTYLVWFFFSFGTCMYIVHTKYANSKWSDILWL